MEHVRHVADVVVEIAGPDDPHRRASTGGHRRRRWTRHGHRRAVRPARRRSRRRRSRDRWAVAARSGQHPQPRSDGRLPLRRRRSAARPVVDRGDLAPGGSDERRRRLRRDAARLGRDAPGRRDDECRDVPPRRGHLPRRRPDRGAARLDPRRGHGPARCRHRRPHRRDRRPPRPLPSARRTHQRRIRAPLGLRPVGRHPGRGGDRRPRSRHRPARAPRGDPGRARPRDRTRRSIGHPIPGRPRASSTTGSSAPTASGSTTPIVTSWPRPAPPSPTARAPTSSWARGSPTSGPCSTPGSTSPWPPTGRHRPIRSTCGTGSGSAPGLARALRLDAQALSVEQTLLMATANGGRAIGQPDVGTLTVGSRADFCRIDLDQPMLSPALDDHELLTHVVFNTVSAFVTDVWVDGRPGRCRPFGPRRRSRGRDGRRGPPGPAPQRLTGPVDR